MLLRDMPVSLQSLQYFHLRIHMCGCRPHRLGRGAAATCRLASQPVRLGLAARICSTVRQPGGPGACTKGTGVTTGLGGGGGLTGGGDGAGACAKEACAITINRKRSCCHQGHDACECLHLTLA